MPSGDLEKFAAAFRENPRSGAFFAYAEALIQHQHPREAVDVLRQGLATYPDNLDARLLLGRAHMLLHEWKEAQGELVKVVKLDRAHQEGFRYLGEVLLRRNDYERALPILQQAQNLDPADARVLSMLKRCREGRPLDPPPPVSQQRTSLAHDFFDAPTNMADRDRMAEALKQMDDPGLGGAAPSARSTLPPPPPKLRQSGPPPPPPAAALRGDATDQDAHPAFQSSPPMIGRMSLERERRTAAEERAARRTDGRGEEGPSRSSGRFQAPVPTEDPFGSMGHDGEARATVMPRGERPKVAAAPNKQVENASEAMRRSAAMGEDFLNQLLGGGLLSVPNVEARGGVYDVAPDRRWGRSTRRAFFFLWFVLIAGAVGGGGWYFWQRQQRDRAVARHLTTARDRLASGSAADFAEAQRALENALQRDPSSLEAVALLAEARALPFYVFGQGKFEDMDAAVLASSQAFRTAPEDQKGADALLKARVARGLAILDKAQDPQGQIAEIRTDLERALKAAPDDGVLLWLDGQLRQAVGDREGAKQAFLRADKDGKGPPIARIALGDLELDDGDAQAALTSYDDALARSPQHPLGLAGRALARVDRSAAAEEAMQDLNVGLAATAGFRTEAWKHLAMAALWNHLEDYKKSAEELDKAAQTSLAEPRFVARLGMLRIDEGRIGDAEKLRQKVRYYSPKPGQDPLLAVLDAEILLARGFPAQAIEAVGNAGGVRALLVRGRAYLDLPSPRPKDAMVQFAKAQEIAPQDWRVQVYDAFARVIAGDSGRGPLETIQKAGRAHANGLPRFLEGEAEIAMGRKGEARRALEASVAADVFNPLAYRANYRIADLAGPANAAEAEQFLRKTLEQAPRFLPAHSLLGRILVARERWNEAKAELGAVSQAGAARSEDELALAAALTALGERDAAKQAVLRAKDRGASSSSLSEAATAIDPAFRGELGVETPRPAPAPSPKKRKK